jgi:lactate dehydrogenase-like 2-hydroxyacid dehydrogenase
MTIKLLWPATRWPDGHTMEKEVAGKDAEVILSDMPDNVTDAQWADCDGIVCGLDPLAVDNMHRLQKCRIFVTPKVGFDNIDLKKWGDKGIPVCNVPDYGTQDVADHAMAILLSLMKGTSRYDNRLRRDLKSWRNQMDNPVALRLSQAKLGIVGCGRIGTAMTLRAKAFGMDVCFHDPYLPNGSELALGISRVDTLEELMARSDILTLHVPLTDETRNLINAETLKPAKHGQVLVNCARGEVVDTDAVYDCLKSGQLGAAGFDVLPIEPANMDSPLVAAWKNEEEWIMDRVVITPHSGFYTPQSYFDMRTKGITVAIKYLTTGRLENCVNEEFLVNR